MKELLMESYKTTKKMTGHNPLNPVSHKQILVDDNAFDTYVRSLSEGLSDGLKKEFALLAKNTRRQLLENQTYQLNPYETLTLPVLRIFYPRLIARELVTVQPIDKPEVVKAFLIPSFNTFGSSTSLAAPSYTDVSGTPSIPAAQNQQALVPGTTNVLTVAGLTTAQATIQNDLLIYEVFMGTTSQQVQISPTVDGTIAATVTIDGVTDTLLGTIDYASGTITLTNTAGKITAVNYSVSISLGNNTVQAQVQLNIEKIRFTLRDREITGTWTIPFQQDIKALFDMDVQAEIVTVIGQQIALDIDREIITSLIGTAQSTLVPTSHTSSFSNTPPSTYTWGPKMWFENILPQFSTLSAQIYTDTNIAAGNMIAANPVDAAMLESIEEYSFVGTGSDGGDIGYKEARIANGRWTLLTSPIVPQGTMLITYKPDVDMKAVFYYAPYQPSTILPYPLMQVPAITVLSRYASKLVRPLGLAVLNIT